MRRFFGRDASPRAAALLVALALIASVVSGREKRDLSEPSVAPAAGAPAGAAPLADLDLERLRRTRTEEAIADLFAPQRGPAPEEAPASAEAAPPPSAPPLPFRYLAKIIDGDRTSVFLMRGADHYRVSPGQVIDRTYRVERVTENTVTFTYLPLGTRQVLAVPALN